MSHHEPPSPITKGDQIAFHFYTKLFHTVNDARATDEPDWSSKAKVDKWVRASDFL
jgi:hypothetical protein